MTSSVCLPQNDPYPQNRERRLQEIRQEVRFNHDYLNPLAMTDGRPREEDLPSLSWIAKVGIRLLGALSNSVLNNFSLPSEFGRIVLLPWKLARLMVQRNDTATFFDFLSDIFSLFAFDSNKSRRKRLRLFKKLFVLIPVPEVADRFQDDAYFAWMRVAGPNPLVLQAVRPDDPTFGLTESVLQSVTPFAHDTMSSAIAENRLYIADYPFLHGMPQGTFQGHTKFPSVPRAWFAVTPQGDAFLPVAIQCEQIDNAPVFTPNDGPAWDMAKTFVQMADGVSHEMISHLGRTHLFIEPFVTATRRELSENHPLYRLLLPHFEGTTFINFLARDKLIAQGGLVDDLIAGTIDFAKKLAVESITSTPFQERSLPANLKARGVEHDILDYPYRDDARQLWPLIERWVGEYLQSYYANDDDVRVDNELQAWVNAVGSTDGGRIPGFDESEGKIHTRAYLTQAVTEIIFTASVQHSAVNFPQNPIMSFAPAMPLSAFQPTPQSTSVTHQDWIDQLPPLGLADRQLLLGFLLGGVHYTRLGRYPEDRFDAKVIPALRKFQSGLAELETKIVERNRELESKGKWAYNFLLPSKIPQSINI